MITSLGANPWRTPSFEMAPWQDTHLADDVSEVDRLILALTSSGPQLPHRARGTCLVVDRLPLLLDQSGRRRGRAAGLLP